MSGADTIWPVEGVDNNGQPTWECPICPFSDHRYFIGGRGAVGNHIHHEHPERAPK